MNKDIFRAVIVAKAICWACLVVIVLKAICCACLEVKVAKAARWAYI